MSSRRRFSKRFVNRSKARPARDTRAPDASPRLYGHRRRGHLSRQAGQVPTYNFLPAAARMIAWLARPIRVPPLAGLTLALVLPLVAGGCGSDPPVGPTPTPPVDNNAPPVISSLTAGSQRAEAGESVQVTSIVLDSETLPDQLQYDWSASPVNGTFVGSGRQVSWRAPFLQ